MSPSAEAKVRLLLFLFCSKNSFSPCGFLPAGMRRFFPSCVLTAWVKKKGNNQTSEDPVLPAALDFPKACSSLPTSFNVTAFNCHDVSSQLHTNWEFSHVGKSDGVHSVMCQRISRFRTGRDIRNHPGPTHTEICQGQSKYLICLSWLCRKLPSPLGSLPGSKLCEWSSLTSRQIGMIRVLILSYSGAPRSLS